MKVIREKRKSGKRVVFPAIDECCSSGVDDATGIIYYGHISPPFDVSIPMMFVMKVRHRKLTARDRVAVKALKAFKKM